MYTDLHILTHTCDVMVSFPHVSMCSSCVEWLHVLVGWYFIRLFLSRAISPSLTHTHTHTGVVSLSRHLSSLSHELCSSYYLVFLVCFPIKLLSLYPFVLSLVTALTSVTTWQWSEAKKPWIRLLISTPPEVFPSHLFPSVLLAVEKRLQLEMETPVKSPANAYTASTETLKTNHTKYWLLASQFKTFWIYNTTVQLQQTWREADWSPARACCKCDDIWIDLDVLAVFTHAVWFL